MLQALQVLFKSWTRLPYFGTRDSQGFIINVKVPLEVRHNDCLFCVQH